MEYLSIIIIALGLSVDSFAVSISCGLEHKKLLLKNVLKTAIIFGVFQGIMPVLGWLAGYGLKELITGIDHWIAFSLLTAIGLKMIFEHKQKCPSKHPNTPFELKKLCMLGLATSIDALAVGIGFAFLEIPIISATLIIAVITVFVSISGLVIGNRVGHFFEKKIQIFGGLVLIGIGIKILIEHLS